MFCLLLYGTAHPSFLPGNLEFETIICPVTVIGRDAQGWLPLPGGDLAICELLLRPHICPTYCPNLLFPQLTTAESTHWQRVGKTSAKYVCKDQDKS